SACERLQQGDWQAWLDVLLPYYDKTYAHSRLLHTGPATAVTLTGSPENDLNTLIELKEEIWMRTEA
ncbi:MAG TPA: hypothetical protein VK907_08790, partial [Phnomibacter sp.]|nr:hypothetical protein [Phnomibacter sp.]